MSVSDVTRVKSKYCLPKKINARLSNMPKWWKLDNRGWVRQEFPVAFLSLFLNLQFSSSVQRPHCAQLGGFKAPSPQKNWGRKAGSFKALGSQTSQISVSKHLENQTFTPFSTEPVARLCLYLSGQSYTAVKPESNACSSMFHGGHFGYGICLGVALYTLPLLISSRIDSS